jgi:hypothetical protein
MLFCLPVLAIAVCQVATAEPRGGLFRNASLPVAEESAPPVSLVGFFYRGGGGYGPSCGCDVAAPSCGMEPSCGAGPSCGGDYWGGYCASRGRHFHLGHLFHHHRGCNMDASCGCDVAAPSCGIEPNCGAAPSCGCDAAPACGCGRRSHFGHHLMCGGGCGGCNYGCRCVGHRHRFWANGWCGQMADGYCGGNPVDCSGGAMGVPAKMAPMPEVAPVPMDDVPAKSTRRPLLSPRFSARPIGAGLQ